MYEDDDIQYKVVMNHEEQYSIWPCDLKNNPIGWKEIGKEGSKQECLEYIKEIWIDIAPLSVRKTQFDSNN
jgi:MbtH protein